MNLGICYMTAGLTSLLMCTVLGIAKISEKYDVWTGEITREFWAYCVVGPTCSIVAIFVGLLLGA